MFFKEEYENSDVESFIDVWIEMQNIYPNNFEEQVCEKLNISMKETCRKAMALYHNGVKLPGFNRKRIKNLRRKDKGENCEEF